ncbi:MAG TPA: OsmC family protein [Bacteroidia bacterium]|nr:OsmC family protein [Bacteroidia bacterium]
MKTSEVVYTGGLRTSCVHLRSGQTIITDAPPDNNGKGEAFSPTDLLSTSLACCMLTIMGIVSGRHGIDIDGTKAEVTKIMADQPRRVSEIIVEFVMPRSYTEKEKQLLENAARTCPVAKSLHPDLVQNIKFSWK